MSKLANDDAPKELQGLAERVAGGPIQVFSFSTRLSVRTADTPAFVQERIPVIDGVNRRCIQFPVVDVSGLAATGADGKMTWRMRDFISPCDAFVREFDRPLSFVATPHSDSPVSLTIRPSGGPFAPPDDVIVEVFTWDPAGSPAPATVFSWRCRVPYHEAFP